jgi:glycosyltransferase involved in cell wall biosynthesis
MTEQFRRGCSRLSEAVGSDNSGSGEAINPRISVVMIFYNAERFIEESIDSVLGQSFSEWELLLVDDGSDDGSTSIARRYATERPHEIKYFEHDGHQNLGMSHSRNLGIENARGEYIAFLDADDLYTPDALRHRLSLMNRFPDAAMVYGPAMHWWNWQSEAARPNRYRKLGAEPGIIHEPPTLVHRYLTLSAETPGTCSVLLRRTAALSVGGFEASFRGMFEDQVFFYKVALEFPIVLDDRCTDWYRQHAASETQRALANGTYSGTRPSESQRQFLCWLSNYMGHRGIIDAACRRALRRSLFQYRHPWLRLVLSSARRWKARFRTRMATTSR